MKTVSFASGIAFLAFISLAGCARDQMANHDPTHPLGDRHVGQPIAGGLAASDPYSNIRGNPGEPAVGVQVPTSGEPRR